MLQSGKIKGTLYAWAKGMENWAPVSSVAELAHIFQGKTGNSPPRPPTRLSIAKPELEGRVAQRASIVATAWLVGKGNSREILGICSDISATGMQVIIDSDATFAQGELLELEVVPTGSTGIAKFVVTGKVQWALPEERRIGLCFVKIAPSDAQALARHVQALKNRQSGAV